MCKWPMYDPEARVKSSLSDYTWLEDLSMDLSPRHLRTYEAERSEEHLNYFFTFILFPSHFSLFLVFTFILPIFLTFLFFSSYFFLFSFFFFFQFFSFATQNFLQHNTYIAFVSENDSSPMLERCSPSSIKERGNDC
jgi:hypothetical protein